MIETLKEIENFASMGMAPKEIEIILGLEKGTISNNLKFTSDENVEAYLRGKLKTEAELNKSIFTLAKQGSSPAQTMAKQLLANQKAKEVDFE